MALPALSIPATPLQMLPYTRMHRKSDQSHSLNTPHTQMQSAKSGTNAQSLLPKMGFPATTLRITHALQSEAKGHPPEQANDKPPTQARQSEYDVGG